MLLSNEWNLLSNISISSCFTSNSVSSTIEFDNTAINQRINYDSFKFS